MCLLNEKGYVRLLSVAGLEVVPVLRLKKRGYPLQAPGLGTSCLRVDGVVCRIGAYMGRSIQCFGVNLLASISARKGGVHLLVLVNESAVGHKVEGSG